MNAHSRNTYYAEEFEKPASRGLVIFVAVVTLIATLVCGMGAGMAFQSWLDKRQREMDTRKGPPARPAPLKPVGLVDCKARTTKAVWLRPIEIPRICNAQRRAI